VAHGPPRHIIVALDFGEASDRALEVGSLVAGAFAARLSVVHVATTEVPPYFTREQINMLQAQLEASRDEAREYLRHYVAARVPPPVDVRILDGPAVEAILVAGAGADLALVGTHGRRGPSRWWLGSVAERVVRTASFPVLVTRATTSADPIALFSNVQLIGPIQSGSAGWWATTLAERFGGRLERAADAARCDATSLASASLVVAGLASEGGERSLGAPWVRLLLACPRPILFVPLTAASSGEGEDQ
jgi:nucleotide-binding universal stress UspA family protein